MMATFDKTYKNKLRELLKGVSGIGEVFNMMNRADITEAEVEARVAELIAARDSNRKEEVVLRTEGLPLTILGRHLISQNAIDDALLITRHPAVIKAALAPDAHRTGEGSVPVGFTGLYEGYDPESVSADGSCSVLMTVTPHIVSTEWFDRNLDSLKYIIKNYTYFGQAINPTEDGLRQPFYLNRPKASQMKTAAGREALAAAEKAVRSAYGTSGDGNHFVEFGLADVVNRNGIWSKTNGKRLAILSHFGSRSLGAIISKVFVDAYKERHSVPKGLNMSVLTDGSDLAHDYEILLNWIGDFTESSHNWLHKQLATEMYKRDLIEGLGDEKTIFTRHNFAWRTNDGIVHRKGATPAAYGQYGVIPATMGHNSQVVIGLGNPESLETASHGAGRTHSRGAALQAFKDTHAYVLKEFGVTLIGGDADEHPSAYKEIKDVMAAQADCVTPIGEFQPRIVRMAEPRFFKKRR